MKCNNPVPFIHVTDIYRPYASPDDHWDLACVYALTKQGRLDLRGIIFDHPHDGAPDVMSVMQMNAITGLSVPMAPGSPNCMRSETDTQDDADPSAMAGVQLILSVLRSAERKVAIQIVGSSRDVAIAANRAPELFAKNCAGIYLVAGVSGEADRGSLEHNVILDACGFSSLFRLDCPIYWSPVYERRFRVDPKLWHPELDKHPELADELVHIYDAFQTMPHSGVFVFRQGDVLSQLSTPVRNYFAFMFRQGRHDHHRKPPRTDWLSYLHSEPEQDILDTAGRLERALFSFATVTHAAGYAVNGDGDLFDIGQTDAIYRFAPVDIHCPEAAQPEWHLDETSRDRFIVQVDQLSGYPEAMTKALISLLREL